MGQVNVNGNLVGGECVVDYMPSNYLEEPFNAVVQISRPGIQLLTDQLRGSQHIITFGGALVADQDFTCTLRTNSGAIARLHVEVTA